MTSVQQLSTLVNKRVSIKLNGKRQVSGILIDFDKFMNVTLVNVVEHVKVPQEQSEIGFRFEELDGNVIVRGSCIEMIEVLDESLIKRRR